MQRLLSRGLEDWQLTVATTIGRMADDIATAVDRLQPRLLVARSELSRQLARTTQTAALLEQRVLLRFVQVIRGTRVAWTATVTE